MNKSTEIVIQHISLNRESPSYSLTIDGSGNIKYNGPDGARTIEKHIQIPQEDLNRIIHEFKDLYFFSFKDSYESPNQPSSQEQEQEQISVSFRLGDKYKKVSYTEDSRVEPSLKILVKEIEKLVFS